MWEAANAYLDSHAGQAGSCCLLDLLVVHVMAHARELLRPLPAAKHVEVGEMVPS
jgi:hypothetical protein